MTVRETEGCGGMINKNVIFPARLTYEDYYPEDSLYETSEAVNFLRKYFNIKIH